METRAVALAIPLVLVGFFAACSSTRVVVSGGDGADAGGDALASDPTTTVDGKTTTVAPLELGTDLHASCMAADETAVYLCVDGELRKIPIDGSDPTVLWKASSGELIAQITLADDRVLATTDHTLHVVGVDGTGGKDLHVGSKLHRALAFSSGSAFVLDGSALVSIAISGGTPKKKSYEFPTYLTSAGEFVWLTEGDSSSDGYDISPLRASTLAATNKFSLGNSGASGAAPRPDRMASDGPRMYLAAAKAVSNRVEVSELDNPPKPSGTWVAERQLGDLDAYAVQDLAADDKGLVIATNDAVYRYDRDSSTFVVLAKGSPAEHIAINATRVFWLDGQTLRGTPR